MIGGSVGYILEKVSAGRSVTLVAGWMKASQRRAEKKLTQAEGLTSNSVQLVARGAGSAF